MRLILRVALILGALGTCAALVTAAALFLAAHPERVAVASVPLATSPSASPAAPSIAAPVDSANTANLSSSPSPDTKPAQPTTAPAPTVTAPIPTAPPVVRLTPLPLSSPVPTPSAAGAPVATPVPTPMPTQPAAPPAPDPAPPSPPAATQPSPAPSSAPPVTTPPPSGSVQATITAAALRHGLDPARLIAVARCESGLNPNAVNPAGPYQGLFQFLPSTFAAHGGTNIWDARQQSEIAATMFATGQGRAWGSCA